MVRKKESPGSIAQAVVKELGGKKVVAEICGIRDPSVYDWYKRGISKGFYKFLRLKFPTLKAWSLEEKLPAGVEPYSNRQAVSSSERT